MADNDDGSKPKTGVGPTDQRSDPPASVDGATVRGSDWTASDRRGPLNEATDDDIERMIPGSETDAEGTVDPHDPLEDSAAITTGGSGAETGPAVTGTGAPPPSGTDAASAVMRPEQRGSVLPIAVSLIIGALIGAGSAAGVYAYNDQGDDPADDQIAALTSRVDALSKAPNAGADVAALKQTVSALDGRVGQASKTAEAAAKAANEAKAEAKSAAASSNSAAASPKGQRGAEPQAAAGGTAAPQQPGANENASEAKTRSAFDPASLEAKIASLRSNVDGLSKQTGALKQQNQDLDKQTSQLQKQNADLTKQVEANKNLETKVGGLATALAEVEQKASSARSTIDAVQSEQKTLAGKVSLPAVAVVADSLVQQIDMGSPYAMQVDAAAALGADPAKISVLRQNASNGVPSAKQLASQFAPLADPIIATAHRAPDGSPFLSRLRSGLVGLVNVRRADTTTGTDIRSRVAQIQTDLDHDDLDAAFKTWSDLSAEAKSRSQAWGARLKTSVEASDAARALQHDAIAALGAKRF